jgi:hypothetical protein
MASRKTVGARYQSPGLAVALALFAWLGCTEPARTGEAIEPIRFAQGASSAEVRGAVVRGERALYSIEAREGQRMSLDIRSLENNAVFQAYAPGAKPETRNGVLEIAGETLPGAGEGEDATRWTGKLPRSGNYLVVVGPTRGNATYRLTVTIR